MRLSVGLIIRTGELAHIFAQMYAENMLLMGRAVFLIRRLFTEARNLCKVRSQRR